MKRFRPMVLALVCLLYGAPSFALDKSWVITSDRFHWHVGAGTSYFEDQTGELTIRDVIAGNIPKQLQNTTGSSINFGYSDSAYWLKLPIANDQPTSQKVLVSVDYSLIDQVNFYWVEDQKILLQNLLGDSVDLPPQKYDVPHYISEFSMAPNSTVTLWLFIKSQSSLSAPISILSEADLAGKVGSHHSVEAAFYGLALGLLCYNLFLMVMLRERIYLEYVVFVSLHIGFQVFLTGYSKFFFPDTPFLYERGVYIFGVLSGLMLMQFSRTYLNTKAQAPKTDLVMKGYMLLSVIVLIVECFASISITNKLNALVVFLGCVCLFIIGFSRLFAGYKSARFFLVGQGAVLISVMFTALSSRHVVPGYEFAPLMMKIGAVLEMLFFSVGLADRINTFKDKEKSLAADAAKANAENEARKRYIDQINSINQELENAVKSRSEFLANMSHEIRTPMNGILGMLELIDDSKLDLVERNYVDIARRSGGTLLELINDILDLSKIEADKLELESASVAIRELAQDLQHLYQQQIQEKGIEMHVTVESGLPDYLMGDRTRLWQILTNLTSNAIKFTNHGHVSIFLKKIQSAEQTLLLVSVNDSGIGIPKDKQDKIFESFTQADGSTTRQYGGTGLGLTISRKLIEKMGGQLSLESTPGVGSKFYFSIPLEAASAPVKVEAQSVASSTVDYEALKVLLVEDNVVNQKVALGMLKKLGVKQVDVAENGADAVVEVGQNHYDMVFMDVQMPVMDGYEATRRIREDERKFKRDPLLIIAMTAHSMEGDKDLCLAAGMNDYVAKPIQKISIEEIFEKYMSGAETSSGVASQKTA